MGTALTGSTVSSTYDSLLKVTDNGPLGGTLKTITDGMGNDSALQLSSAGVKSLGTLETAGELTVSVNNVGVTFTAASGTAARVWNGADDYLSFRPAGSGFKWVNNADDAVRMLLSDTGVLRVPAMPTASAGLSAGDLWSDGGTIKIIS